MNEVKTDTCTRLKDVLVDVKVEATFEHDWAITRRWRENDIEGVVKATQEAADEFVQFLRDHRSQDMIQLYVVRQTKDLCSSCKEEWEPMEDEGETYCACCGAIVVEEKIEEGA